MENHTSILLRSALNVEPPCVGQGKRSPATVGCVLRQLTCP